MYFIVKFIINEKPLQNMNFAVILLCFHFRYRSMSLITYLNKKKLNA